MERRQTVPIEIVVILGVLFLFGLIWAIIMCMVNADKILDRLSDHPEDTEEKNRSGMKKIEEFREHMETFKYMANDSKQVRIADGFLEWIDAIDNEFCEERTNLQLEIKALEESVNSWKNECYEERAKATEKLIAAQEETSKWKRKYFKVEKEDPLYEDGLLFHGGRDADGMLMRGMDAAGAVVMQIQLDEFKKLSEQFDKQAKELTEAKKQLAEAKKQLEIERSVVKFSGLETYVVHAWQGDSLWKIYRHASSQEALYEQLHRDGYYRIDYTQKIEEVV